MALSRRCLTQSHRSRPATHRQAGSTTASWSGSCSYDATTGVAGTYYTVGGSTPDPLNPAHLYSGPFLITGEGSNTLKYFSKDVRGNSETVKSQAVRIDKTRAGDDE